jgi:hypothetical protein
MVAMKTLIPLVVALLSVVTPVTMHASGQPPEVPIRWQDLQSPQAIWPGKGAIYYTFSTDRGARVHLVVVDVKSGKWLLKPFVNEPTTAPTSVAAALNSAGAGINAGFFNLSDGASASYVIIDGKEAANPKTNKALVENPKLKPFLAQIFNRSELRILQDANGKTSFDVAAHEAPISAGQKLIHSVQAGPQLLPTLTAEKEAFVRTEADDKHIDSIGTTRGAARTAVGITDDGYALLATVADARQDPESSGVTLQQLADLLKRLGCVKAINFDGGASTTMFVRLMGNGSSNGCPSGQVVCGKNPETRVKSVLLLQSR